MKSLFVILFSLVCFGAKADDNQPTSEGATTLSKDESPTELILRLGNESNPVDGLWGPYTFGLRASHKFANDYSVEAGYIRLHEPDTPFSNSLLDEAQLSVHFPESSQFDVSVTLWKNRLIDMYTNVMGLEVARKAPITLMFGGYAGSASLDEDSDGFRGAQLGLSGNAGPIELSAACLLGMIGNHGSYRKCGVEGASNFFESGKIPVAVTFGIEARKYNFGDDGPVSEPKDEFIFITGLEIHFEKLVFKSSKD